MTLAQWLLLLEPLEQQRPAIIAAEGQTINIPEAKTQVSRLVKQAAKIVAPEPVQFKRLGFMTGAVMVPKDVDRIRGKKVADYAGPVQQV